MTISWPRAIILSIFASLSSTPGMNGTSIGNYTLGRPLVGGLVCGVVPEDTKLGIACGVAMQLVYIALVAPGGTVSVDVQVVSYVGIPLAMVAIYLQGLSATGTDTANLTKSVDTLASTVGVVLFYGTATMNSVRQHMGWKDIEKEEFHKLYLVNWAYPWISHIYFLFILTLIITKLRAIVATALCNALPVDSTPMKTLFTVGTMLSCVEITILLRQIVSTPIDFIPFLVGFTLVTSLKLNLVSVAIVSLTFAFLTYQLEMARASKVVVPAASDISANDDGEDT